MKTVPILKALSDENRLRIFYLLNKRKLCVCELAHVLGVSQPAISRHLRKLKSIGLIREEQDSFWTNYCVSPRLDRGVRSLLNVLTASIKNEKRFRSDFLKSNKIDRKRLCG